MKYRLQSMYNHIVGQTASVISPFYSILLGRNLSPLLYGSNCKSIYSGTYSEGAMGAKPPWTSEIYWFQGVFRPQRVLSPTPRKIKKIKPPPRTNSWICPWIYYIKNRGGDYVFVWLKSVSKMNVNVYKEKEKILYSGIFIFIRCLCKDEMRRALVNSWFSRTLSLRRGAPVVPRVQAPPLPQWKSVLDTRIQMDVDTMFQNIMTDSDLYRAWIVSTIYW